MATVRFFNGKKRILPGFYMRNISAVKNKPVPTPFGTVLIIDTGVLEDWGSLGSINGELSNGEDAIYELGSIAEAQSFMKGGYGWKLMEPLFRPETGFNGIGSLMVVRAATTTAAKMTFSPTGGGANGGTATIKCRDEGIVGNGVIEGTDLLVKGYAYTFTAGKYNPSKFLLNFWLGTYKDASADKLPYDEIYAADTKPSLVIQSPEFDNMNDLKSWMDTDKTFNALFSATVTVSGDGSVDNDDLTNIAGLQLALGGTTVYTPQDLTDTLQKIPNYEYKYIFELKGGIVEAQGAEVSAKVDHITNDAKFVKFLMIGGGDDDVEFADSLDIAGHFNTTLVNVVHGGVKIKSQLAPTGYRVFDATYKAAIVLGRMLGLAPQIPVTNKSINIDGEVSRLTDNQREQALVGGVITTYYNRDRGLFVVTQGVNTLQNNDYFINNTENITQMSFSTQVMRIVSQVDQTLTVNAQKELLSQENGVNQFTLSTEGLKMWIIKQLALMTASDQVDGYIKKVDTASITVTCDQDNYDASYGYYVNGEITKIFVTSTLLG